MSKDAAGSIPGGPSIPLSSALRPCTPKPENILFIITIIVQLYLVVVPAVSSFSDNRS